MLPKQVPIGMGYEQDDKGDKVSVRVSTNKRHRPADRRGREPEERIAMLAEGRSRLRRSKNVSGENG